jgi:hypothetical protein
MKDLLTERSDEMKKLLATFLEDKHLSRVEVVRNVIEVDPDPLGFRRHEPGRRMTVTLIVEDK